MKRTIITLSVVILLFLTGIVVTPIIIFGGHKVFTLRAAPALTGQVSQAMAAKTDRQTLPVAGKDYNLRDTRYFDGDAWAVTTIVPTGRGQSGLVVLQKQSGIFAAVLGPGTSFPDSSAKNLPDDVSQYLMNQGYLYEL